MDNFLASAQDNCQQWLHMLQCILHVIDTVSWWLVATHGPYQKESISVKKLLMGDVHWSLEKIILGWDIDTKVHTTAVTSF